MHPFVESQIAELVPAVDAILPGLVEGIYLHGSAARGAFDEQTSDVDVTAVLARAPTAAETARLLRLHRRLPRVELECLVAGDWHAEHDAFNEGRHERWTLSVVNRIQLRGDAVVVRGPHPSTFLPEPARDELLEEMRFNLEEYWPAKVRRLRLWLDGRWVGFGVATLGRILYTLETGELVSKPAALAWLRDRHPEWRPLLDGRLGRLRRARAARRFVAERVAEGRRLLDVS